MSKIIDLTGNKYNRLLVLEKSKTKKGYWLCLCDCGTKKEIRGDHLREGSIKSCGCLNKEDNMNPETRKQIMQKLKHKNEKYNNLSHTKIYRVWYGMKERCYNKKHSKYKWYGKRGIKVCDEWKNNFLVFYNWAINNRFNDKLKWQNCTIDRINNNGNYEPENCRFIDLKLQAQNKRNNFNITYNNETHCLAEWARILKIDRHKVKEVLLNGTN